MSRLLVSPERFVMAAFDALTANIAILDAGGRINAVNRAWDRFAPDHAAEPETTSKRETPGKQETEIPFQEIVANSLGVNSLAVCDATQGEDRQYAVSIAAHIRAVLAGQEEGETEYPCALPDGVHDSVARVSGFDQDSQR